MDRRFSRSARFQRDYREQARAIKSPETLPIGMTVGGPSKVVCISGEGGSLPRVIQGTRSSNALVDPAATILQHPCRSTVARRRYRPLGSRRVPRTREGLEAASQGESESWPDLHGRSAPPRRCFWRHRSLRRAPPPRGGGAKPAPRPDACPPRSTTHATTRLHN